MITIDGLVDHQVVQRDTATSGQVVLSGTTDGPTELRAFEANGRGVTAWTAVHEGSWKVELTLPVGGPYDLVARCGDELIPVVRSLLVGDLWLMGGQSNMQGSARLDGELETPSVKVGLLDMTRTWRQPIEPLHRIFASPDRAHHQTDLPHPIADLIEGEAQSPIGAGLGIAFANRLVAATGVPVGLIATAHGGTSMAQWSPELKDQGGASLYGSMLLSLEAAGGRIAGCIWYQGESDAGDGPGQVFDAKLQSFVSALRSDAGDSSVPFIHVQLGCFTDLPGLEGSTDHWWNVVREAQRTVDLGPGGVVTAIDLPLDDPIHISTSGLRRLGRRMARLAAGRPGLTIGDVSVTVERVGEGFPPFLEVRVPVLGADGLLSPPDHLAGFEIRAADGTVKRIIYSSHVEQGDGPVIVLRVCGHIEEGDVLWHGYGRTPYCNLVDAADQALPAFGPLPLPACP